MVDMIERGNGGIKFPAICQKVRIYLMNKKIEDRTHYVKILFLFHNAVIVYYQLQQEYEQRKNSAK